jgi:AraC-like DNA-binding protein
MRNLLGIGLTTTTMINCPWNTHPVWEIVYYTENTGLLKIGEQELDFSPGDIICQPPNIPHCEISSNGYGNIYFTVEEFDCAHKVPLRFKDNIHSDVKNLLMIMYREFHMKKDNWRETTQNLLNVLSNYIQPSTQVNMKNPYVNHLEELLVANIGDIYFKVEDAMDIIPLSKDYLRRVFRKETGYTPLEYLIEKRLDFAKLLMEKVHANQIPIKYIALQVGFKDPYYFSRVFKKSTGMSPTQWIEKR